MIQKLSYVLLILVSCCAMLGCDYTGNPSSNVSNTMSAENINYQFSFSDSTWLYKGKPFELGKPIGYYTNLFGPYSRRVSLMDSVYVWDSLGIMMIINKSLDEKKYPKTHLSDRICFVFDYKYQDEKVDSNLMDDKAYFEREVFLKKTFKEENDARPRPFFAGSIRIGGVALHKGMTTDELNVKLAEVKGHLIDFTTTQAIPNIYTYCYPNAANPFCFELRLNDNGVITDFIIDLTVDQ